MEKKYELINETMLYNGIVLHRIQATMDFSDVKSGEKGGWIAKEINLSQEGNCWVYNDAKVYENSVVIDDAKIFGNAKIYEKAFIYGNAKIYDNVNIYGCARIYGNVKIFENVKISENSNIFGNVTIKGDIQVFKNPAMFGNFEISGDAIIGDIFDYMVFKNWWSNGCYFTWTRSNNMWTVGCFHGTGKELIEKAYQDSELSGQEYERIVKYVEDCVLNVSPEYVDKMKKEFERKIIINSYKYL